MNASRICVGLLLLVGCASSGPPAAEGASTAECSVTLAPRQNAAARPRPAIAPASPESRIVVHAEVPLRPLERTLEKRVPKRLAEGRARIGPGGTVSYTVERGALSLRVTPTSLLVEAPARARAEACRGNDCYASCEPEARIVAEVPLMLRPDYRFRKTSVSATFTRGCKVRALGGLLTLDVTPTLEAQLAPELERVAREIDEQLPALESRIAEGWTELAEARSVPLGGCFRLQPFGIIQGPFLASTTILRARFAVQARPELGPSCDSPAVATPLPPLATDAALPEEGVTRLGMVTALASVARALESASPPQVARAEVTSRGKDIDAHLALRGRVCGDVALQAALSFEGDGQYIGLTGARFGPGEEERLAESGLDENALTHDVRIAPLLSVRGFQSAAPSLAAGASRLGLEVRATVSSTRAAGAMARNDELVAWLEARGAIWLKLDALLER
ncbi:MAG: hypothetical protein K0R38_5936 [Polyangiaceae bacterium]|nr:hypothetical protein [Polyangiaceae bacterium]